MSSSTFTSKDPINIKREKLIRKLAEFLLENIPSVNVIESIKIRDNIPNCSEYVYGIHAYMPDHGQCRIILKKSLFEKKNLRHVVSTLTHELAHSLMADLFTTVELSKSITKNNINLLRERQAVLAAKLTVNALENSDKIKEILKELSDINDKLEKEIDEEISKEEEEARDLEPSEEETVYPNIFNDKK